MIPFIILAIENEDDRDFMVFLYQKYRWLIFSKVKLVVQDSFISEDLVQDVIVKLIDKVQLLRSFDSRRLASYIAETAKNTAIDYTRKTKDTLRIEENTIFDEPVSSIELEFLRNHNISELKRVWPELKPTTQEVLTRKYFLLQSDEEIAKAFNVKPASVRMILTRARKEAYDLLRDTIEF